MKILRGTTTRAITVTENASNIELFPDQVVPPGTRVTARFPKNKVLGVASFVRGENWTTFPITRREFCAQ